MTAMKMTAKTAKIGSAMRGGRPISPESCIKVANPHAVSSDLPDVADLQMLFAQYNFVHFDGEIPSFRIAYNARFSNVAGRITYKPPLIELSPKHLRGKPEELRQTLLHEMIHAWLHARGENPGHTPTFKKKMRELGLPSIYHDLGSAARVQPCVDHLVEQRLTQLVEL